MFVTRWSLIDSGIVRWPATNGRISGGSDAEGLGAGEAVAEGVGDAVGVGDGVGDGAGVDADVASGVGDGACPPRFAGFDVGSTVGVGAAVGTMNVVARLLGAAVGVVAIGVDWAAGGDVAEAVAGASDGEGDGDGEDDGDGDGEGLPDADAGDALAGGGVACADAVWPRFAANASAAAPISAPAVRPLVTGSSYAIRSRTASSARAVARAPAAKSHSPDARSPT